MATSYTIAIASSDASGPSATIHVDVGSSGLRVTDLSIRPARDGSALPRELATLNLRSLLSTIADLSGAVGEPDASAPAPVADTSEGWDEPPVRPAARATAGSTSKASARQSRRASTSRGRKAEKAVGRAYRRTPDDIVETFQRLGGVTAVAEHYGVPRHTAQGWVRRLRKEGALPDSPGE